MKALLRNNLVACVLVCAVSSLVVVDDASADIFADPNLVGFWQFNNNTSNDSSAFGNDGTFVGDANSETDILELDGTDDYVEVADDYSLDLGTHDLSFGLWLKTGGSAAHQAALGKRSTDTGASNRLWDGYGAVVRSDGTIQAFFRHTASSDSDAAVTTTGTYDDNKWYFVAATYNRSSNLELYIDGVSQGTADISYASAANIDLTQPLAIGCRVAYGWSIDLFFNGFIDDVMIYDVALEAWEIRQLYEQGNKRYGYFNEITADVFRGSNCTATGKKAVALGDNTEASGNWSTAFGADTIADGNYATAMGYLSKATGDYSFAVGRDANASSLYSTAVGNWTKASGDYSAAIGDFATASGSGSIALASSEASGNYSTAIGDLATASGGSSVAIGDFAVASGGYSTAIGHNATASAYNGIAMGYYAEASDSYSTALGSFTTASGPFSTAMGYYTTAGGGYSFALGKHCINNDWGSFAVGYGSGVGNEQVDFRVRSGQVNVYGNLGVSGGIGMDTLVLPVKGSDPANPIEGQIYVNILDNKVRVYADGAWRDLATW